MSNWQKVKIGDFLKRIKRPIKLEKDKNYKLVTIKMHHNGIVLREEKQGSLIKSNMYEVHKGDFILSGIDARNGAFGIIPEALDKAIVTNDFWYFELDENIVNKYFFLELTATSWFDDICKKGSDGTTQRIRLQKDKFFNQEIVLPPLEEQIIFIKNFKQIKSTKEDLESETSTQQSLLKQLKQTILQEAIEGKLTAKYRVKNPDIGTAKELLDQIKIEKEKLIKEKKLKASKPLAPINEDEIPFDIPQSWEWCRLGEVCNYGSSSKIEPKDIKEDTWILDLEDIEKESSKLLCKIRGNERNSSSTKSVFHQFDVLYSKLRPYLDKVIVADENGVCTTEILPLTFYINIDSYYAMYALKRKDFLKYVNRLTKGMKMPRLGTDDGKNALFPLPPLEEQKEIVATIEKFFAICDELEAEINQNKTKVDNLMATVLKEAFEK